MTNFKFYDTKNIDKVNADYNLIFGERSNGKTSAVLEKILKTWIKNGKQGAYIRRYDEEIKGNKGEMVFSSIANERDLVSKYTKGKYDGISYYNRKWYLTKWDESLNKAVKQGEPFCYAFALNQAEHYKGTSYPDITTVCFDEFLTRKPYLVNEYVDFNSVLSTIIRQRDDVTIYMLGNTVNKYCPYFDEMGLNHVEKMKIGTIDVYEYGEDGELTVAVEYCGTSKDGKKSDKYFAFDNPKLKMITSGAWELPMYPHAPFKIAPMNILDKFYILFRGTKLQGDIILQDESLFIYIHEKTTDIKEDDKITFSLEFSPKHTHAINPVGAVRNKMGGHIKDMFKSSLVYYQNNNIGELVRNYLMESKNAEELLKR